MCFIVSFALAFFLIGSNQLELDGLSDIELYKTPYKTIPSALLYMWDVCLGGGGSGSFAYGAASQKQYLYVIFISA